MDILSLAKYSTETHELKGTDDLGLFPASMETSEWTGLLYAVNFNLHGEMEPSTMMIVDPETMDLVAELPTGVMPHGTRMNSTGRKAYHVSMMSDELLEVDTYGFKIARRLALAPNMVTETTTEETGMEDLKELLNMDQSSGSRMGWMKEMNNQSASSDQHSQHPIEYFSKSFLGVSFNAILVILFLVILNKIPFSRNSFLNASNSFTLRP